MARRRGPPTGAAPEPGAGPADGASPGPGQGEDLLPFETSVGYQIRLTNRMVSRYLAQRIAPHGLTLGMWYFLRALWHRDGQTQRELSVIVGTMEPTTLTAVRAMERAGLVRRAPDPSDRRKLNVWLTARGRSLRAELLPVAREVVEQSVEGFSGAERAALLDALGAIQRNLGRRLAADAGTPAPEGD